jgi:hypothetical protein
MVGPSKSHCLPDSVKRPDEACGKVHLHLQLRRSTGISVQVCCGMIEIASYIHESV